MRKEPEIIELVKGSKTVTALASSTTFMLPSYKEGLAENQKC